MSEWHSTQKMLSSYLRKLPQERIEKANPRCELTTEEAKRLAKLEGMSVKLKRRKNVQSSVRVTHYLHTNYWYALNV